jgi:copper(I)-binding protein
MRFFSRVISLAVAAFALIAVLAAMPVWAGQGKEMSIDGAFARATIGQGRIGAVFLMIHNPGSAADRLIGAASSVAERAELHTHKHENGVMKMRPVDAIAVPANGMAALKPGGDHVMLMGLSAPLKEGDRFELVLKFEKAGAIPVMLTVGPVGAMGAGHGGHKHKN